MNTPQPDYRHQPITEEQPISSFTRAIAVAPKTDGFTGWGPSRWN